MCGLVCPVTKCVSCLINPSAGREFEWGGDRFTPATKPKKILIIGGGVAGLEAARVAAERGHQVTLVEASDKLGGQFRLAGLQPRRQQIIDYIDWLERQVTKLQVRILMNAPMDADELTAFGADEVIVATGSQPDMKGFQRWLPQFDALPGVEFGQVFSAEDVMAKRANLGKRVIMLDETANWKGTGTTIWMAEQGHLVTVVTGSAVVMAEMARTAADLQARARLRELGATLLTEHVMLEWHGNGATVQANGGQPYRINADTLVISATNVSERWLSDETGHATIGDATAARTAAMAIYDGRKWGMEV
jgi:glycine/D-amino acid oxidase-like deaminating enzyme